MHLARSAKDPDIATRGMNGGPVLIAYCSSAAHYSYLKTAKLLGIGSNNLRQVPCDPITAEMNSTVLHALILKDIENGGVPFFIGSTAGTTVVGGYDNFVEINKICQKYNIWHHVDACWGGGALLSSKIRHPCCQGIEKSQSISWNPHKMLGCALQTSIFLVSGTGDKLKQANGTHASYLFQPDKLFTEYDVGDKTIQCGRKTDSIKIWMMWKSLGDSGFASTIERCYSLHQYMINAMKKKPKRYVFVVPPSCTNICFWYVPLKLRTEIEGKELFDPLVHLEDKERRTMLHGVAPRIKAAMQMQGGAMIGFQTDETVRNGDINFFRMVFSSCDTVEEEDVDATMRDIERVGESIL